MPSRCCSFPFFRSAGSLPDIQRIATLREYVGEHRKQYRGVVMATVQELKRIQQGPRNQQERVWWDRFAPEKLQQWRYVCDPLADECIQAIGRAQPSGMLQQVEALALAGNPACHQFISHCHMVPGWVDFEAMESGRRVFARYAPLQAIVLLCSSLVEGYTIEKAVKVLVQTGRLQKDVSRRIFETGQMLHNIAAPD